MKLYYVNQLTKHARLGLVCLLVSQTLAKDYTITHSYLDKDWRLVFPAVISGGKAYLNWGMALEILSVECDGKNQEPSESSAHQHLDEAFFENETTDIIYVVDSENLISSIWKDGRILPNKLRKFSVEQSAKIVTIKYRVHFADGKSSEINTLKSVELNAARRLRSANGGIRLEG